MSLDAQPVRLIKLGTVTVTPDGAPRPRIVIEGFRGQGSTCRDVAALAVIWAIGELQRELLALVEQPGGGSIGVD